MAGVRPGGPATSALRFIHFVHFNQYPAHILMPGGNIYFVDPPEGSVGVCADLVVEVEERMELVVVEDVVQEVGVLVTGLGQAVDVVKTVKHQTHGGVGYFVLSHLIAVVTTAENNGYDHHSLGSTLCPKKNSYFAWLKPYKVGNFFWDTVYIFVPQWFTVKHCPLG